MKKPYVISAELDMSSPALSEILQINAIENFRESLDTELKQNGKSTVWVPSESLRTGLVRATEATNLPVVSLDDRYVTAADAYLGVSRGSTAQLNDDGYVPRRNCEPVSQQLADVSRIGREIVLVDDVLFSGEMVVWLADQLKAYNVKIGAVIAGIAVQEGVDKLLLEGIDVEAVVTFDQVEDEICERDFAVVPGSGRRIDSLAVNALYFDNVNGRPEQWASIDKANVLSFCTNSIRRSINLLQRDVQMRQLGEFLGYGTDGSAVSQLTRRLKEQV